MFLKYCMKSEKKDVYILGDFNVNLLNHGTHNNTNDFWDIMFSFNLFIALINKASSHYLIKHPW